MNRSLVNTIFKRGGYQTRYVLSLSLAAAIVYALYASVRFSGDKLLNQYYYVVPVVAVFVIFWFDRAGKFRERFLAQWLTDAAVVTVAMWRVIGDVPYVSGHTLFLTYALLTIDSRPGRAAALLVLLETLYLKFFVWHDPVTATGGIVLGLAAAGFAFSRKAV